MIPKVVTEVAFGSNPGDATPTWTDISAYVKNSHPTRGRNDEFEDFGPGTNSLVLDNTDRRFDPSFTDGPYYPNVLPMRRVRQYIPQPMLGLAFHGDFEGSSADGTAPEWTSSNGAIDCHAGAEARQLQYVTSPVRVGSRAARIEVATGDQFGASTGERCMLRRGTSNAAFPISAPEGTLATYQFSFRPLAPWTHPTGWEIFQQFKVEAAYGQPIVALETNVARTNFVLSFVTGDFPTAGDATNGTNSTLNFDMTGPAFAADVWWDVRYQVKWTTGQDGFFIFQMKQSTDSAWTTYGERIMQTRPTTAGVASTSLSEQVGLYRNASAFTNVVFHDGYQVAYGIDPSTVDWPSSTTDVRWNDTTWEGALNILDTQGGNSSFETGTSGASTTGGGITISVDPSRAKFGSQSLKIVTDGSGSSQGVHHTKPGSVRFDVTAGKNYVASAWYSGDSGDMANLRVEFFDVSAVSLGTTSGLARSMHTDFRRQFVEVTAPAGAVTARVSTRWSGTTTGTFWVDDVGLWEGTMDHFLFDGYVDSWTTGWPDRLFNAETTVPCSDGKKVLTLLAQPTSNPSVEDYADVVAYDEPWGYYRFGEPSGYKVTSHVRKKKHHISLGSHVITHTERIRTKRTVIASEVEGVSGPAGVYLNNPVLGITGAIAGDSDTAFSSPNTGTDKAQILLTNDESNAFGRSNRLGVEVWIKLGAGCTIIGPIASAGAGANEVFRFFGATDISFRIADTTGTQWTITSPTLNTALWYHVFGAWDGTILSLYVNGVLAASSDLAGSPVLDHGQNAASSISIAADGGADEFAVYEAALSPDRIYAHYIAGTRGYAQEATGTRITNALANASFPLSANIQAGQRQILPVRQFGQSTLDPIDEAVETEGGRSGFFFSGAGRAMFLDRFYVDRYPYNVSQKTFGDAGTMDVDTTALAYEDVGGFALQESDIYNEIRVEAAGGTTQEASDGTMVPPTGSQGRYLKRTFEKTGVPMVSDADALDEAQWILARRKEPFERVTSVTFPVGLDNALSQQAAVREIGDRITVVRYPRGSGGSPIPKSQVSTIEGLTHDIDFEARTWQTTYRVSPVTVQTAQGSDFFSEAGFTVEAPMPQPVVTPASEIQRVPMTTG